MMVSPNIVSIMSVGTGLKQSRTHVPPENGWEVRRKGG